MIGGRPQVEEIYSRGVEPREIPDPGNGGAIDVSRSGYILFVSAGAETRTLARPTFIGQELQLNYKTDVNDIVITASASINASSNTTITLNDVGDYVLLRGTIGAAGALFWRVVVNDGATLG